MAVILRRAGHWLARILLTLSALCLVALMCLTVAEVIGRYVFNSPIFGRQDIAQILLACSIFLAFTVFKLRWDQIAFDLLDRVFSRGAAYWRDWLIGLLTAAVLLTMGYWLYLRGERFRERGTTSELLFLPEYPLVYFIAATVLATGVILGLHTLARMVMGRKG